LTVIIRIDIPAWLERIGVWVALIYRRLRFGYPFRRIPLTKGKFAIVDPDDYARLAKYKWHATKGRFTYYAQRKVWDAKHKREITVRMHREVLDLPESLFVDHINHNGLDNRKANVRPAAHWQNVCNRPKSRSVRSRSKYKGVTWHKAKAKWHARIRVKGRTISLGYFEDDSIAAAAYDEAAKKHHGRFAVLNFPDR
jgi:hypothetical protein